MAPYLMAGDIQYCAGLTDMEVKERQYIVFGALADWYAAYPVHIVTAADSKNKHAPNIISCLLFLIRSSYFNPFLILFYRGECIELLSANTNRLLGV